MASLCKFRGGLFFAAPGTQFGTIFSFLFLVILLKMNASLALEHFGTVFSTY
jgi:hypothetical protein